MIQPTTPRRAATRDKLVRAAIRVIASRGVHGASVEDICEAAGFTRGAFYSNFENKDQLCEAILEHLGSRYVEATRHVVENAPTDLPVAESMQQATAMYLEAVAPTADDILVMGELRLYAAREPGLRPAFMHFTETAVPMFGTLLVKSLEENGLTLRIPTAEALTLLDTIYTQAATNQLIAEKPLDGPEISTRLRMVLEAMIVPLQQ